MNLKDRFLKLTKTQKIGLVVVLVLVAFFGIRQINAQNSKKLATTNVQKGTVNQSVKASGNVTASGQVEVYSTANGNISELYIKNGDKVVSGQRLFRVKSTATDIDKASSWASYMSSVNANKIASENKLVLQALLEQTRKQILDNQVSVDIMKNNVLNNFANPVTGKGYNQIDIDSVNSSLTSARENFAANQMKYLDADTAIAAASASQNAAWLNYQTTQDAYVTSPATGTVSNLLISVGDKVRSQSPTSANAIQVNPALIVGNFNNLYIVVTVNELNIAKIKLGQSASVTFDGIPGQTFKGLVTSIDTVGQANQGVVSYNVRIDLKDVTVDNSPVKPGMTTNVTISTQTEENVLEVPNSAIFSDQGQDAVQIVTNSKPTIKHIKLGLRGDSTTQVIEGLSEGDQIVTSPAI